MEGLANQKVSGDRKVDFEEAIKLTGHGRFHYLVLFGSGCCLLSMIIVTLITGYLLPSAQCDLQLTTQDKGLLNAICFIGMICSSHLWGFLADTQGRRSILITTLTLDSICGVLASFSPTFGVLIFFRFFNGFFICGPGAVMYAYLGEFHSCATRTRAILWAGVFVALGITGLPGLAWMVLPQSWSFELPWYTYNSWRFFMVVCSIPSLVTASMFYFLLPESPKFLLSQGREEEALQVLRYVYSVNTGHPRLDYPVKALELEGDVKERTSLMLSLSTTSGGGGHYSKTIRGVVSRMWAQTEPLFSYPHLGHTALACLLDFGIFACSNGFILWLPEMFNRLTEYGRDHAGHSMSVCQIMAAMANATPMLDQNATILATNYTNITEPLIAEQACSAIVDPTVFLNTLVIGGTSAITYLAIGSLVKYVGKKWILIVCLTVSGACGIAVNYVHTASMVLTLSCVFMALSGCCISVVNSVVVDIFPTQLRAMAVCISLMMGRVGTVIGSVLVGLLLEISCASVFFALGGTVACCGFLCFLIPSTKRMTVAE